MRAAALSGSQLATYDTMKPWLLDALLGPERDSEPASIHLFCSLMSGLVAQTVIQPLDTARSCVMASSGGKGGSTAVAAVVANAKAEGARWFFRGSVRVGPPCAARERTRLVPTPAALRAHVWCRRQPHSAHTTLVAGRSVASAVAHAARGMLTHGCCVHALLHDVIRLLKDCTVLILYHHGCCACPVARYVAACCRQGPIMLIQMPIVEQLRLALGCGYF